MQKEELKEAIINGYRTFIYERYDYEKIKDSYDIPKSINKTVLDDLRAYYLSHIYPQYQQRKALEEAFYSLDRFIQQPQKLVALLFDATKLIFKYGRSLPKILGTGLKALQTFNAAQKFEHTLVSEAIRLEMKGPFDEQKIKTLLQSIPRKEIDAFVETSQSLFETLHDRPQVKKIKEIIQYVLTIMRRNPNRYSKDQIKGLEMGYALLYEGDTLLQQLPLKDQIKLIRLITEIELDMLNKLN